MDIASVVSIAQSIEPAGERSGMVSGPSDESDPRMWLIIGGVVLVPMVIGGLFYYWAGRTAYRVYKQSKEGA